ncbi:hypothetical protein FEE95_21710 [Maribacter algarum]|uniref:Metal-dependent HD superfamily phosphohydrolase n=1 Tax=Maribacter algarum (ex Zhang et al. 2020) TaxID=2578118 RepID=A0A5S3PFV1_9FLAO|nr:hypothetical protein [Maribacter algarum]TMM52030.1 hypothetical protein FEE95_21710 [Maribacter algarum]
MDLKERYAKIFSKYVLTENEVVALWNELAGTYGQKFRKYHNLGHLTELFAYFDKFKDEIENTEEMLLAIYYHDFIYSIWKKDNEEKSAIKATQVLQDLGFDEDRIQRIEALILCTKHHNGKSYDEKLLIDFDLAILGQSEEVYQDYARKIRKEYAKIPSIMYRKGRKKVLQHFLDKSTIYQTKGFQSAFEKQARANLSNELNTL